MAHLERRMTPLYLLEVEKEQLDKHAKRKGVSRQKLLEGIISSGINRLENTNLRNSD